MSNLPDPKAFRESFRGVSQLAQDQFVLKILRKLDKVRAQGKTRTSLPICREAFQYASALTPYGVRLTRWEKTFVAEFSEAFVVEPQSKEEPFPVGTLIQYTPSSKIGFGSPFFAIVADAPVKGVYPLFTISARGASCAWLTSFGRVCSNLSEDNVLHKVPWNVPEGMPLSLEHRAQDIADLKQIHPELFCWTGWGTSKKKIAWRKDTCEKVPNTVFDVPFSELVELTKFTSCSAEDIATLFGQVLFTYASEVEQKDPTEDKPKGFAFFAQFGLSEEDLVGLDLPSVQAKTGLTFAEVYKALTPKSRLQHQRNIRRGHLLSLMERFKFVDKTDKTALLELLTEAYIYQEGFFNDLLE